MPQAQQYLYGSQGYTLKQQMLQRPTPAAQQAAVNVSTLPNDTAELRKLGYTEEDIQAILAARAGQVGDDGTVLVDPNNPYGVDGVGSVFQALYGRVGGSSTGKRPLKLLKGLLGRLVPTAAPSGPGPTVPTTSPTSPTSPAGTVSDPVSGVAAVQYNYGPGSSYYQRAGDR